MHNPPKYKYKAIILEYGPVIQDYPLHQRARQLCENGFDAYVIGESGSFTLLCAVISKQPAPLQ